MMSIEIETAEALRGIDDLRRLISAVVHASDHDEADWIEWKSTLDLAGKEGCFQVARAILGLANRLPERALLTCGGLGYVIVGAEPGGLTGIASVDPATLDQIIQPYLGGVEGPVWAPHYASVEGKTVLVAVVEAPRPGDKIFTLRKEFDKYLSGTVFVRRNGLTVQANASELDALQVRLKGATVSASDLEVCLVGDVPVAWLDESAAIQAITEMAAPQRDRLVAEANAEEQRRHPPTYDTGKLSALGVQMPSAAQQAVFKAMASSLAGLGDLLGEPDPRTLSEYVAEVDDWANRLAATTKDGLLGRYFSAGHGVVTVQIRNLSQRFLPDVELEVVITSDRATFFDEKPKFEHLPEPRKYGERKPPRSLNVALLSTMIPAANLLPRPLPRLSVESPVRIRFRVGDVRPEKTELSAALYLFVPEYPESGALGANWSCTVRGVDAVLTGNFEVPVTKDPVDFRQFRMPDDLS